MNVFNDETVAITATHENLSGHVQRCLRSEIEALEHQIALLRAHPSAHRRGMIATYERLLSRKKDFLCVCTSGKSFRTPWG